MTAEELLAKWANKKYPKYQGKIKNVATDLITKTEGFCPTCSYETALIELTFYNKARRLGSETINSDLATILNEVLLEQS